MEDEILSVKVLDFQCLYDKRHKSYKEKDFLCIHNSWRSRCSSKYFNTSKLPYNSVKYPWKIPMKEVYNRKAITVNVFLILHYFPYLFIISLSLHYFPYSTIFPLSLYYFPYLFIIFLISSLFSLSLHYFPYLFIIFLISSFFPYLFLIFLISSFFFLTSSLFWVYATPFIAQHARWEPSLNNYCFQ